MQHVEGAWIVVLDLFVVGIVQELAELVESVGNVGVPYAVDDVDDLAALADELEFVLLAIFGGYIVVVEKETDAGQADVQEYVPDGVDARVLVARDGACARRGCNG